MIEEIDRKFFTIAVGGANIKRDTTNDIAVRCPHCSSDERWKHATQMHLYEKNGVVNVNCFTGSCPVVSMSVYTYLKEFHPQLLESYKQDKFKNNMNDLQHRNDEVSDVFASMSKAKPNITDCEMDLLTESVEEIEPPVHVFDLSEYFHPLDICPDHQAYVAGRGFDYKILQEKFGTFYVGSCDMELNDKNYMIQNALIIPLYYEGVMYGFYSRSIEGKEFYTFNPDNNFGYKVWNWFNVDFTKPLYVFESVFDAISYAVSSGNYNVIATMGAKLGDDRTAELKHPIYALDNDRSGFLNGLQYAKQGHDVFIQPNHIIHKDMNLCFKNGIDCAALVKENIFTGISAEIELNARL